MESTQNIQQGSKGVFMVAPQGKVLRGKIITQEMVEGNYRSWFADMAERFIKRMMRQTKERNIRN